MRYTWGGLLGVVCITAASRVVSETKVQASDGDSYDAFGQELALDGTTLIVGAHGNGDAVGAAYLYERTSSGWGPEYKLIASDGTRNDWFGFDVDVSGDHVIVGAPVRDPDDRALSNNNYGGAYFFLRGGTTWSEHGFVQASDRELNREFGRAVAISGDYAVVGARFVDGKPNQGKAYVFQYKNGAWEETQILIGPDGLESDEFGMSVEIDGDYIFVGGVDHRMPPYGHMHGAVWVWEKGSNDAWQFETKLSPADLEDANVFGILIEISGDAAIVGAEAATGRDAATGVAYVFRRGSGGLEPGSEARCLRRNAW